MLLLTNRNAYEERILRETQAFVYTLNSEVQTRVHPLQQPLPRRARARRLGQGARPHLQRARPRRHARAHRGRRGAAAGRTARARSSSTPSRPSPGQASAALGLAHQALAATAHPIASCSARRAGRSYLLGSQVQSYGLAISLAFVTLLLGAAGADARARRERARAPAARGRAPRRCSWRRRWCCARSSAAPSACCWRCGFGIAAEISSSGAAWARIPLLLVPLAARGRGLRRARLRRRRGGARPARRLARRRRARHADRARRPRAAHRSRRSPPTSPSCCRSLPPRARSARRCSTRRRSRRCSRRARTCCC